MSNSSSKSAVKHHIAQRLTAVALVPTSIWFVSLIYHLSSSQSLTELGNILLAPANTIIYIIFILAFLYHGMIGMHSIITDYVHCNTIKKVIMILLAFLTIISAISAIFSIIYFFIVLRVFFPC